MVPFYFPLICHDFSRPKKVNYVYKIFGGCLQIFAQLIEVAG